MSLISAFAHLVSGLVLGCKRRFRLFIGLGEGPQGPKEERRRKNRPRCPDGLARRSRDTRRAAVGDRETQAARDTPERVADRPREEAPADKGDSLDKAAGAVSRLPWALWASMGQQKQAEAAAQAGSCLVP